MKIAFVVTDLSNTRIGGISRVATEVGANLVELGHEVTAYVLRRSPDQKAAALNGIRLRYIEPFPTLNLDYPVVGFSYRAFGQLKRDLNQDRFDIVQSFNLNAMALCRYAKTIGNAGGRVVVSSYETIMMDVRAKARELVTLPSLKTALQIGAEYYLAKFHESRYLSRADAIITEDYNTSCALRELGIPDAKINIIESGVDVAGARSARPPEISSPWRNGGPVIGYIGRIDPRKGVQYLLQSMPQVLEIFPHAQLVMVGGSRHGYDRVVATLTDRLRLSNRVHLLGRIKGDILPYYKLMDVIVIPSLSEGIPITLGEAMAAEVPVVITRLPGVVPFINPPDLVHWADLACRDSLAEAVIAALGDENRDERICRAANFIRDYTWRAVAERHANVYAAQLQRSPAARP